MLAYLHFYQIKIFFHMQSLHQENLITHHLINYKIIEEIIELYK